MDYNTIKQLAQDEGLTVKDLIALAPQHDPFYVGTEGDLEKGRWFADLWHKFGYGTGVHLRRMHYQLVSQDPPVLKPNGKPYENTEADWDFLGLASTRARYLGLVDSSAFVDRRNPDPVINAQYWGDPEPSYSLTGTWGGLDVTLPTFPDLPGFQVDGYDAGNLQPYHLEVWVEKTTMNDVLEPLCQRYGVNLVTGAGELSITATLELVRRVERADRPCRIFYISDFDPAGFGMPVSVARKIEFFIRDGGLDLDIRLEPIALTQDQVQTYRLPRTPIKETEKRRGAFEGVHGEGAVELDALEALHPGTLAGIVETALLEYYDGDIEGQARERRHALQERLSDERTEALADLEPEIDELREHFDQAVSAFDEAVSGLRGRLADLHKDIVGRLEGVDVNANEYPLPDPKTAWEDSGTLFDSTRDYLDQLAHYQARKNGGS